MVGTKVNEFSLPNNDGTEVKITEFFGKKNVVVVLLRDLH
jgi:peroxiredoxin